MKIPKKILYIGLGIVALPIYVFAFQYAVMLTVTLAGSFFLIKNLLGASEALRGNKKTSGLLELILNILWILLFLYLGYTTYDKHGDDVWVQRFFISSLLFL